MVKCKVQCEQCGIINSIDVEFNEVISKEYSKDIICVCSECNFKNELVLKFKYTAEEDIEASLETVELYDYYD